MKTIQFNVILLLLLLPGLCMAEGVKGKYTKEKKLHKSYAVNADAHLAVANKYGNVYVTSWDENKTEIDVVVTVSGNNEEKVIQRLENIDVIFSGTKPLVNATTKIGSGNYNNISMEINYTIKIPKKGSIFLSNQYGGITIGTVNGKADIDCQYGSLTVDQLNNAANNIQLQYSDGKNINYINKAVMGCDYSGLVIKKINDLNVKTSYTDLTINDSDNVTFNSEYGDVKIKKAGKISGKSEYTGLRFGTVSSLLNITSEYGNIQVDNILKGTKNVSINSSYTNVNIKFSADYVYDFEFQLEYGNLNGSGGLTFSEKKEKDFRSYYKGYYRNSGVNKVYIKSEYGNIVLGKS